MRFLAFLILLALGSTALYAQQPEADHDNALVEVKTVNAYNRPVQVLIALRVKGGSKVYADSTNRQGLVYLKVPNGQPYELIINNGEVFAEVNIPKAPNIEFRQTLKLTDEDLHTATQTEAVLKLVVFGENNDPIIEPVRLKSRSTGQVYSGQLNDWGIAYFRLPIGQTYEISFKGAPRYDKVDIPNKPFYRLRYKMAFEGSRPGVLYPSLDVALFKIVFTDLNGMLVAKEPFYLEGLKDGKVTEAVTDNNGLAQVRVPIGQRYSLSSAFNKNFTVVDVGAEEGTYIFDISFTSLSTADWEKRIAERMKRLKAREAAYKAGTWTEPKRDTVVATVLNRNKWVNKLVVADVTGSMSPYINQFKLWYELNYETSEPMQLVMFNDGDGKATPEKKIGRTGGIYFCNYCTPQEVFFGIEKAMGAGSGGDGPENDLEAVIKALNESTNFTDLILIADNYSPVRDMALLQQIEIPVKVVICGGYYGIHEDYLNIAYQTGGSVHTIEEDIVELSKKVEGDVIKVGNNQYVLRNGQFILLQ